MKIFNVDFTEKNMQDFCNNFNYKKEMPNLQLDKRDKNFHEYLKFSNYNFDGEYHIFDCSYSEFKKRINLENNSIKYKLNNNMFRSENFKKNHQGTHILFAGCSETFGEGGNIENNWTSLVYDKLKENNELSGYFNLGYPGFSWEEIITYIKMYIYNFGKPDIIAILAPNLIRSYLYDLEEKDWYMNVSRGPIKKEKEYMKTYSDKFVIWSIALDNFINYCNQMGIKIIWSTWSCNENNNISRSQIFKESFFELNYMKIKEDFTNIEEEDIKRRDGHMGTLWHKYVADQFLNRLCNKYFLPPKEMYNPEIIIDEDFIND